VGPKTRGRKLTLLGDTNNPYNLLDTAMDSDVGIFVDFVHGLGKLYETNRGSVFVVCCACFRS